MDSKVRACMCSNFPGAPPISSMPCTWRAERLSLSTFRKAYSLWTPGWENEAGARSPRPWSRCEMLAQTPWICALKMQVCLPSRMPKRNWNDFLIGRQYIKRTSFPPTSSSREERPFPGRFSFLCYSGQTCQRKSQGSLYGISISPQRKSRGWPRKHTGHKCMDTRPSLAYFVGVNQPKIA